MVLFGDSWSGSEKGYLNVYFYPQDSSYGYCSSGYIYSSFRKTAKLWWGPFQGGHGAVYATIDGQSDGYPIAECDNASRVIKYVAILGYCYSSYDVVTMRVHDIRMVADLSRHDPTAPDSEEPVELDGMAEGVSEAAESSPAVQHIVDLCVEVWNHVATWWEGWWPRLHMSVSFSTAAGGTVVLHLSVDILFELRFEDFAISTPAMGQMSEEQQQAWALSVAQAAQEEGVVEDSLRQATELFTWTFSGISAALAAPGLSVTSYAYTIAAALSLWAIWFESLVWAHETRQVSTEFLIALVGMWLETFLGKAVTLLAFCGWLTALYTLLNDGKITWGWLGARIILGIVSIGFQFFVAVATLNYFIRLVESSAQDSLEASQ